MLRTGLALLALFMGTVRAQQLVTPAEEFTKKRWSAAWITSSKTAGGFGVLMFRKTFELAEKPGEFVIHLSADHRYHLWVNGQYVNEGPQLGDLRNWHFESLDIANLLQAGKNVVAVQVIDFGATAPLYQMGKGAALIVQGATDREQMVSTPSGWLYQADTSITAISYPLVGPQLFYQFYAAGPTQQTDAQKATSGWQQIEFDDTSWKNPTIHARGAPHGAAGFGDEVRELVPRTIPLLERSYQTFGAIRRAAGFARVPLPDQPISVPAHTTTSLLLDQRQLTVAYPEWHVAGGAGATIKATYAEAVFDNINQIGHRDSIGNKLPKGVYDVFIANGQPSTFTTLSPRTFRYVLLEITTQQQSLTISKMGSWFVAYPFQRQGYFMSSDSSHKKIYQIGWHTARLCAFETYMDCPYWERLQYVGDTRIQALVSYMVSGDDRLARNAIRQFYQSLTYDGLTYSRYPSSQPQFIPNYALVWVLMVHDFWMYRTDDAFVRLFLPGMQRVLEHFEAYRTPDGLMGLQAYWDFLDHTHSSKKISEESKAKGLASNSLFYALTLRAAADLMAYFNYPDMARAYRKSAQNLTDNVRATCWDASRKLFADSPDKKHFSMHANILAVLANAVKEGTATDLLDRIMSDASITPTTLYFDFYLGRAIQQSQSPELYQKLLMKWNSLLDLGLTTFPEGVNRSECHAWSASPNFEMPALFAGIQPASPGFKTVRIQPQPGNLKAIDASVAHWAGELKVRVTEQTTGTRFEIELPPGITGFLIWKEKRIPLRPGPNRFERL